MFRFMTATTFLLAVLFYQASGGADFEPWERETPDYVTARPDPYQFRESARREGGNLFVSVANASEVSEDTAPIQLASIAGKNDSGLDPALDGLEFARVTPASLPASGSAAAETPHSLRGTQAEAASAMALSAEERQAVLRGTIPASVQQQPAPEVDLRRVTGDRVNLRSGPGTSNGVLATLTKGTPVEILETQSGWVHLRVQDSGQTGWMADWLVSAAR
ncbi:SH3 domain-containing protein [Oceanicola sp. S124]|uniref:SH3 domain-containing protein n=1 Tax=Oceanicola sp. S124 TaxID=1042378 RepID=UPI00025578BE|nr:SH3 domain-containing protein [Oceanicola sp. S124]